MLWGKNSYWYFPSTAGKASYLKDLLEMGLEGPYFWLSLKKP